MWQGAARYPDPSVQALDKSFEKYCQRLAAVELLFTGCRWAEGPVWFGDGSLPAVERHPEQSHPSLGRGDRRDDSLSKALELRERQHARPPGATVDVRARNPAGDADRV